MIEKKFWVSTEHVDNFVGKSTRCAVGTRLAWTGRIFPLSERGGNSSAKSST
jgi:hypothetical protein